LPAGALGIILRAMNRFSGQIGFDTGAIAPATALALLKLVLRRP
jgi:hypothetical protein